MEELNKNQIVLLTLLVSFVTSIATGIVTVSLVDEAGPEVTQTINRVVERTVEKAVPVQSNTSKQTPIIMRSDDLIVDAVGRNVQSIVRIIDSTDGESVFVGFGAVISKDGKIIIDPAGLDVKRSYSGIFSDGKTTPLSLTGVKQNTMALLEPKESIKASFVPIRFSTKSARLGETVVALGGGEKGISVGVGVIASLPSESSGGNGQSHVILETSLSSKDAAAGYFLADLSGEIIGMHLGDADAKKYDPASFIKAEIAALSAGQ